MWINISFACDKTKKSCNFFFRSKFDRLTKLPVRSNARFQINVNEFSALGAGGAVGAAACCAPMHIVQ